MPKPLEIDLQKNQKKNKNKSKIKDGNDFWHQVGQLSVDDGSPSKK